MGIRAGAGDRVRRMVWERDRAWSRAAFGAGTRAGGRTIAWRSQWLST